MLQPVSTGLRKVAEELIAMDDSLTKEDVVLLNSRAPTLVKMVKENLEDKNADPFKGLTDKDKRLLLAFVVYKRQNITTEPKDRPNDEDAAKILHEHIYALDGTKKKQKETLENLEEDLKKQLSKAGLPIQ